MERNDASPNNTGGPPTAASPPGSPQTTGDTDDEAANVVSAVDVASPASGSGGGRVMTPSSAGAGVATTSPASASAAAPLVGASSSNKAKASPSSGGGGTAGGTSGQLSSSSSSAKAPPSAASSSSTVVAANGAISHVKSLKKGARKKRKTVVASASSDDSGEPATPKSSSSAAPTATMTTAAPANSPSSVVRKIKKPKRKKDKEDIVETKPPATSLNSGKPLKKARKVAGKKVPSSGGGGGGGGGAGNGGTGSGNNNNNNSNNTGHFMDQHHQALSPAQLAVNEQMRKALEEDQYSANGSIVDTDSDDDEHQFVYKGQSIRLDRPYLLQAARKHSWLGGGVAGATSSKAGTNGDATVNNINDDDDEDEEEILASIGKASRSSGGANIKSKKNSKKAKGGRNSSHNRITSKDEIKDPLDPLALGKSRDIAGSSSGDDAMDLERDEGSIFGQTTGASNATWVECDKCKKWRRLRGVVDERKLPPKWYCSMNKNDPDRARCSAPEEEYDAAHTPESAADARTRKHLRVWVRRLQCNEQYEARQPTLTRGKKRAVASSSREPHEWVRCCNPSCGKWRAVLRIMDAKQNVIDRTTDGEWYCVMNTWDEKTASCAAPQENLPAVGCPPWVLQDEY